MFLFSSSLPQLQLLLLFSSYCPYFIFYFSFSPFFSCYFFWSINYFNSASHLQSSLSSISIRRILPSTLSKVFSFGVKLGLSSWLWFSSTSPSSSSRVPPLSV